MNQELLEQHNEIEYLKKEILELKMSKEEAEENLKIEKEEEQFCSLLEEEDNSSNEQWKFAIIKIFKVNYRF